MSGNIIALLEKLKPRQLPAGTLPYAELVATSNFSFLRGGSSPQELVLTAAALGLSGLGLCDRNSFAGVVRAHSVMSDIKAVLPDFRYVVGTRLVFGDGTPDIVAYPTDLAAYGRLCRLLTACNLRTTKGKCELRLGDLEAHADGNLFILIPDEADWTRTEETLTHLRAIAGKRVWLAAACRYRGDDRARLARLAELALRTDVQMLAVNDVLYHDPRRRVMQDTLTCIREHMTIFEAGRRLEANAERHIKMPEEMARLFRDYPRAIMRTGDILKRIHFSLDQLEYNYPEETVGNGETAQQTLERLTWDGARKRYENEIPQKVIDGVTSELKLIEELKYAAYFLTVQDIVRFARYERGILCQGRGSAANSMVCYCLEITDVEPMKGNLVFGRFLSTERNEPPDIDVDFEHERREEVMQYIYGKYGRARAGLTATVITYRSKGAMREVAKVFGLSSDAIEMLNSTSWSSYKRETDPQRLAQTGINPDDPVIMRVLEISSELMGFPRHLSQHVGGFILTRDRLDELVPVSNAAMEDRTVVEWDKADIESLKLLKVDVLALGMLTCLKRAFRMMEEHYGQTLSIAGLRTDDERVYRMTHRADTVGVFQIESRAQMSMLPRLKPQEFYDLVIEVAIVRPGPIQGGMVHPYLKRRLEREKVTYPSAKLADVLKRTLGVPLFQEQAMQIAIVGAGFSPGEADHLRRSMATFKRTGGVGIFREKFLAGMAANNYPKEFAEACFRQIEGFGSYGFPESHAASFALLVYVSCWLKCHYPDVFLCALLNSQPMGFYAPSQLVRDAVEHGVEVRSADVNHSDYWSALERDGWKAAEHVWTRHAEMRNDIHSTKAVRLGLHEIKGIREADAQVLVDRRGSGYASVRDVWLRTGLPVAVLERLADADAFGSLGISRRQALWAVRGLVGTDGAETLPLFDVADAPPPRLEQAVDLPLISHSEAVVHDYRTMSLSLRAHPLSFMRRKLDQRGTLRAEDLGQARDGQRIEVAGLVLVRQRPGTASGIVFATLEDETGIANIVIWRKTFDAHRPVILKSRLLAVRGKLQIEGLVIHVIAESFTDMTDDLIRLANGQGPAEIPPAYGDHTQSGPPSGRDWSEQRRQQERERQARAALPGGRNFH